MKKSLYFLFLSFILIFTASSCSKKVNNTSVSDSEPSIAPTDTETLPGSVPEKSNPAAVLPELQIQYEADFILYYVACGSMELSSETASKTQPLGLFQSVPDQKFSVDPTGLSWGYTPKIWMAAEYDQKGEDAVSRWSVAENSEFQPEDGFEYSFEVPNGTYEVVIGFVNPFSYRTVALEVEGSCAAEEVKLYKFKTVEETIPTQVEDGMLNIKVWNPVRGKDAMKNPVVSYFIVRAVPEYNRDLLACQLNSLMNQKEELYTPASWEYYQKEKEAAEKLFQSLPEQSESTETERGTIKETYLQLKSAIEQLTKRPFYDSFRPGEEWLDLDGERIQAHGGQVQKLTVPDRETGEMVTRWWWIGEDKSLGYRGGIRAYSSEDLYQWKFEGVVMRNLSSREQLDTDPYFTELYAGYSKEELDNVYRCINDSTSVIERPKMIYNKKTGQYVIWFHADGPTEESDANYAAAAAGVAVSDSPYGPFRFIDRYRLNTCPEDQEDQYPQSKGMARDMNLFVEEDGTAYIIYSSEENLTMYISRLNEEYTYLDVPPEEAVHGKDFVRLFPGAQREAPAVFYRGGSYYMMTSGATGWAPNRARYYRADFILGTWEDCGDPCVGDTRQTTFDSQSTCIFQAAEDTYIYMGDRWNSEDLADSRYVWLNVQFTEEGDMQLNWEEEWRLEADSQKGGAGEETIK